MKKLIPCPKNTPPEVLRLLTGTMPISGRIDILKLRYFWKLHHAEEQNVAHQIYLGLRENFLRGNEGYIHEIFNLCCKYGRMDFWHGKCPGKMNPLTRISKIVEEYHVKRDTKTERKTDCIYTGMMNLKEKKYTFEEKFTEPGRFQSTEHRGVYLHAILDTAKYERVCKNCGKTVKDLTEHGLAECKSVKYHRKLYKLRLKLYDAPKTMKLLDKEEALKAAMTKKCLMKVVCEFLIVIWK